MNHRVAVLGLSLVILSAAVCIMAAEPGRPAGRRLAASAVSPAPDFQRHILPLMGRLGCNTRSCHGSFQGQGGFRLSLFGYDFATDHEALLKKGSGRVALKDPEASKILQKPTLTIPHKGGKRMEEGGWQYRMLLRWIEGGAKGATHPSRFDRLEVVPPEIVFRGDGERVPLRVTAHWEDGTSEDVTRLARFRTNDESIAEVSDDGLVTSKGTGDTHVITFYDNGVAETQVLRPVSDRAGARYPEVPAATKIDALVIAKLRKLGIVPSGSCTDAEFLRRVSLDMTGTLPTPDEVEAFLADHSPRKRERKVDELLTRPTYAAWWAAKLCEITGNSARLLDFQGTTGQAAKLWYDWVYRRVKDNVPYDEIVAGLVMATSRRPGQSYDDYVKEESAYYREKDPADFAARETMPYYWARRNLRKSEEKALAFSYAFLGVRLECAQCHKHPFDQWTQDDFEQFTAFFSPIVYGLPPDKGTREAAKKLDGDLALKGKNGQQQRQILEASLKEGKPIPWQEVYLIPGRKPTPSKVPKKGAAKTARVITPKFLGAEEVLLAKTADTRGPLLAWMRRPDNPYFARAFVNRVWAAYFGRGIINPPDDMNLANPPSNPALLDYLADGFARHGFDMKWLHREIATSQAYQRGWKTNETNRLDERNFSRALVRRLPAEVVIDAVAQATASPADLPGRARQVEGRAIGVDGTPGLNRKEVSAYASRVFGKSSRESNCDCGRDDEPNLLQAIYLQNDQELLAAIERREGWVSESFAAIGKIREARRHPLPDPKAADALARRIGQLEARLRGLPKGADARSSEALRAQLDAAREELQVARRRIEEAKAEPPLPTFDVDRAIREAYLRTLSRRPDPREAEIARAYFAESGHEAKGLRDLLWALLNTKEFITNH